MPTPEFLPGQTLPAAELQKLGNDDSYLPELSATVTNPTLGTGSFQAGTIWLNGNNVQIWIAIAFGTAGADPGSGSYEINLPPAYPIAAGLTDVAVGSGRFVQTTPGNDIPAVAIGNQPGNKIWLRDTTNGVLFGNANPWIWAATDSMSAYVSYLTDFGV